MAQNTSDDPPKPSARAGCAASVKKFVSTAGRFERRLAGKKTMSEIQPTIKVSVQEIRISVEDLAYLKSFADCESTRCWNHKANAKLKVLGLLEKKLSGPCVKAIAKLEASDKKEWVRLHSAIKRSDWREVQKAADKLADNKTEREPKETDVITKAGINLLKHGTVTAVMQKGCL